jgi:hypothetical protein
MIGKHTKIALDYFQGHTQGVYISPLMASLTCFYYTADSKRNECFHTQPRWKAAVEGVRVDPTFVILFP